LRPDTEVNFFFYIWVEYRQNAKCLQILGGMSKIKILTGKDPCLLANNFADPFVQQSSSGVITYIKPFHLTSGNLFLLKVSGSS
jgi:hypothetical protein